MVHGVAGPAVSFSCFFFPSWVREPRTVPFDAFRTSHRQLGHDSSTAQVSLFSGCGHVLRAVNLNLMIVPWPSNVWLEMGLLEDVGRVRGNVWKSNPSSTNPSRGFLDYENWRNAWNEEKASFCCRQAGKGCPTLLGQITKSLTNGPPVATDLATVLSRPKAAGSHSVPWGKCNAVSTCKGQNSTCNR